jgi:DNA-binding response OmpR family regulator
MTERPHVLIVSDDQDLSMFLAEGLTIGGLWTSVIASGLQAIEVFHLRTFDAVLVDAVLSGLGAIELVRRLRMHDETGMPLTDVPLLIVAGSADEVDRDRAMRAGADGIMLPPIEIEELIPQLFQIVGLWRNAHPDRPWADEMAQQKH